MQRKSPSLLIALLVMTVISGLIAAQPDPEIPLPGPPGVIQMTQEPVVFYNGGFEIAGTKPRIPADWAGKGLSKGTRRICGNPARVHSGNCAFRFRGEPGKNSRLIQQVSQAYIGETEKQIRLSAYAMGRFALPGSQMRVVWRHADGTRNRLRVGFPTGDFPYVFVDAATYAANVTHMKVVINYRASTGALFVDSVSLTVEDGPPNPLTPSATPSATATATVDPLASPTVTASATVTPTPTITASATVTPTPTITASATVTPTPTITASPTVTATSGM
jgi:hypothetical protein